MNCNDETAPQELHLDRGATETLENQHFLDFITEGTVLRGVAFVDDESSSRLEPSVFEKRSAARSPTGLDWMPRYLPKVKLAADSPLGGEDIKPKGGENKKYV